MKNMIVVFVFVTCMIFSFLAGYAISTCDTVKYEFKIKQYEEMLDMYKSFTKSLLETRTCR